MKALGIGSVFSTWSLIRVPNFVNSYAKFQASTIAAFRSSKFVQFSNSSMLNWYAYSSVLFILITYENLESEIRIERKSKKPKAIDIFNQMLFGFSSCLNSCLSLKISLSFLSICILRWWISISLLLSATQLLSIWAASLFSDSCSNAIRSFFLNLSN